MWRGTFQPGGWRSWRQKTPNSRRGVRNQPRRCPRGRIKSRGARRQVVCRQRPRLCPKVPFGEIVVVHASAVQGAEVITISTDARVQVVSDHARAKGEGSIEHEESGDRTRGDKEGTRRRRSEWRSKYGEQRRVRQSWPRGRRRCAATKLARRVSCRTQRQRWEPLPCPLKSSLQFSKASSLQGSVTHGQSRETQT